MMEAAGVTEELKARDPMGGADEHAESTSKGSHPIRKSKTKWSVFKLIRVAETIWTVVNLNHAKSCFANF